MIKNLFALVCLLLLGQKLPVRAASPTSSPLDFYNDGKVIGFIGDSITYASYTNLSYVDILNQYYLSLFPDRQMEFRNISAGGYKISDVLNIYDQDPALQGLDKAVIMLGTNEAILGISVEEYINNMSSLIDLLKRDGLDGDDILILSPPVCDENCSINFTKSGSRKWAFEDRVLEYMDRLETQAARWDVRYLDLHTPMAALTEALQKEDPGNTLTTDCIHPNATGQMFIAYSILQAQGGDMEALSQIHVPENGEPEVVRNGITDFYRGEKGICMTLTPEVLPLGGSGKFQNFNEFLNRYQVSATPFRQIFRIEGLPEDVAYCLRAGSTELGTFTGKELAEGIDPGTLEQHPQQQAMQQTADLCMQRHREVVEGRDMWIEVMMQRASFTSEQIQDAYQTWREKDDALRGEIYGKTCEMAGQTFRITVTAEGFTPEELEQDAAEAARNAAEEQAAREAEEAARRAALEQAEREALEAEKRAAQEQAQREEAVLEAAKLEADQAAKEADIARKKRLLYGSLAGVGALLLVSGILFLLIRRAKNMTASDPLNRH